MTGTAEFYDGLAPFYDRLYPDWEAAVREQGDALHGILERQLGPGPLRVLDAAAGIGTQLLGLAEHGHTLTGTDLSVAALHRAADECRRRRLPAVLGAADMRALPFPDSSFDVTVCADNAVAHLMTDAEVTRCLAELARVTRPGGAVVVTVRDYEDARVDHPTGTPPQVWTGPAGTTVTLQVWGWSEDGRTYDLQHFQLSGGLTDWTVVRRTASLWAITRPELSACAQSAGLDDVAWLLPHESGFFQPVLTARVPGPR